jgi:hypothetical protein
MNIIININLTSFRRSGPQLGVQDNMLYIVQSMKDAVGYVMKQTIWTYCIMKKCKNVQINIQ